MSLSARQKALLERLRREQVIAQARNATPAQRIALMDELYRFARALPSAQRTEPLPPRTRLG